MGKGTKTISANEYVNVKDIRKKVLYRKDNYIIGFLKVPFIDIDLMTTAALKAKTKNVSSMYNNDKNDFAYCTFPRELNLDDYKSTLKNQYKREFEDVGRKRILSLMLQEAAILSTNGENFEHQHFLKVWEIIESDVKKAEEKLLERLLDYQKRYQASGSEATILEEAEIIKMCNLFGNQTQASYEIVPKNTLYEPIMMMKD